MAALTNVQLQALVEDLEAQKQTLISEKEAIQAEIEALKAEIESLKTEPDSQDVFFAQVWEGGTGNIVLRTPARDKAEAINNLCEMNPLLLAIGCNAEPLMVGELETFVAVPELFQYGDDIRNANDKLKRESDQQEQPE